MIDVGGQDASEAFEDVGHSDEAREILNGLLIGNLKREVRTPLRTTFPVPTRELTNPPTGRRPFPLLLCAQLHPRKTPIRFLGRRPRYRRLRPRPRRRRAGVRRVPVPGQQQRPEELLVGFPGRVDFVVVVGGG